MPLLLKQCGLCVLRTTEPERVAKLEADLITKTHREASSIHGFPASNVYRHLQHTPDVLQAREAHLIASGKRRPAPEKQDPVPQNKTERARPKREPAGKEEPFTPVPVQPPVTFTGHQPKRTLVLQTNIVDKEQAAWQLRLNGHNFYNIAVQLGLLTAEGEPNPKAAWNLVHKASLQRAILTQQAVEVHRTTELDRLDELEQVYRLRATTGKAIVAAGPDGSLAAIGVDTEAQDRATLILLQISKERRKLLGIDAPKAENTPAALNALMGGARSLPAALARLDPPPTREEIEAYVNHGTVPKRGASAGEPSYARERPYVRPSPPVFAQHAEETAPSAEPDEAGATITVEAIEEPPPATPTAPTAPTAPEPDPGPWAARFR